ncbi:MAG TPA: hypothetical protein VD763_01765 [Candidatus Saccharimonadales bacterium]|nr:hypothetical protein [Candidatus Saccharimonadales bacterium]
MGDEQKPQDEAGPEEIAMRAIPGEDKDVEGHGARSLSPDAPDDDADAQKPGPDEAFPRY